MKLPKPLNTKERIIRELYNWVPRGRKGFLNMWRDAGGFVRLQAEEKMYDTGYYPRLVIDLDNSGGHLTHEYVRRQVDTLWDGLLYLVSRDARNNVKEAKDIAEALGLNYRETK